MSQKTTSGLFGGKPRRLDDVRFIGGINGRYTLSSRRGHTHSSVQVFACRVQSISPKTAVITAPVSGNEGEWVTAHFEDLGILRAQISRHVDYGFAMEIAATDDERVKLGARIDWVKKKTFNAVPDKREFKRSLPRDPRSTLILPNGRTMECFIIDMSRSGAAVSADIYPEIGMPLAVGAIVGRVVRHLEVGFAVQFMSLQDTETLEASLNTRISLPSPSAPETCEATQKAYL